MPFKFYQDDCNFKKVDGIDLHYFRVCFHRLHVSSHPPRRQGAMFPVLSHPLSVVLHNTVFNMAAHRIACLGFNALYSSVCASKQVTYFW